MTSFLFINNSLALGGVETVISSLSTALIQKGHQVTVAFYEGTNLQKFLPSVRVVPLHKNKKSIKENFRLFVTEDNQAFDTVVSFKMGNTQLLIEHELEFGKIGTKTIGSLHGCFKYCDDTIDSLNKLKHLDTLVVLTEQNKKFYSQYIKHIEVAANPLQCFNYPLDINNDRKKIIAYVGRVDSDKRVDLFIKAAKIAKAKLPDYKFLIVGDGRKVKTLKLLNAILGFPVEFHRSLHNENLRNFYNEIQTLVLPSEAEGLPNILVEAAWYGVARICTNFDGDGLFVLMHDHEDGLVTSLNHKTLAKAMIKISQEDAFRAQLVEKAQILAKELKEDSYLAWEKILGAPLR